MDANCWFSVFPSSFANCFEFKDNMDRKQWLCPDNWCPCLNSVTESSLERKGSMLFTSCGPWQKETRAGRKLDKGTEAGHGGTLFTGLLSVDCSAFHRQTASISQGWYCPQWVGPPTSMINQDNAPQICPQAILVETFSQLRFPLPRCPSLVLRWWKTKNPNCFRF